MSKLFTVFLNQKPIFNLSVTSKTTIRNIKDELSKYFFKNKIEFDEIKLFLNNQTESPVFNTNKYDKISLDSVWTQIQNGHVYITSKIEETNWLNVSAPEAQQRYEDIYKEIPKLVREMNIWKSVLEIRDNKYLSPEKLLDAIPIKNEIMRKNLLKKYPYTDSMYKYYIQKREDQFMSKMVYPDLSNKEIQKSIDLLKYRLDDLHFWINKYIDIINQWKRSKGYEEMKPYKKYWVPPQVSFEINGKLFKNIVNTLSSISPYVNFQFISNKSPNPGLYVQTIGLGNVSMIILGIPIQDFEFYDVEQNVDIGIDLQVLKKYLKSVKAKDIIKFVGNEDKFNISKSALGDIEVFDAIILDENYLSVPKTYYSVIVRMKSQKLYEILRDLNKKKDKSDSHVKIKTTPNSISFDDYKILAKDFPIGEFAADPLELEFPIKSFLKFVSAARNISKNVDLSMGDNVPLNLSYNIPYNGFINYYLAPQLI